MPCRRFLSFTLLLLPVGRAWAQSVDAAPATPGGPAISTEATDVVERFVNWLHHFTPEIDEGLFHWIACVLIILLAVLLRHVITDIIFHYLKKLAARTESTLHHKLLPALEPPAAALIMVLGIFGALTALQSSAKSDRLITGGATIAILGVLLWGVIRAGGAILDHLEEVARARQMTVASFMPLIKKTLLVFALIIGVLLIADSLGAKIGVFLTSLGIGGLAFALAAQDTIANLFGSFVVVIDQPFRVGDYVKIGTAEGNVEDIGLRSTKIRTAARTLIVIPNKAVASEAITNFTRMPQRRVDQVLGLSYDTTPEQMEGVLADLRKILREQPGVQPESVQVNFANYGESSLDIQIVYFSADPDWARHMDLREQLNLKFMRAVDARGASFAFPTQTVHVATLPGGKG
ncbi:MAG: mechanosensitive ion channel family protein [Opitutales bacterium]